MPTADVLLTYAWCRSAYCALRSYSQMGLRVAIADASPLGMCQGSRYPQALYRYAPPLIQPEQFVADVSQALERSHARFLLPGHDETEILSRYRHRLPPQVVLPVAPAEVLALANDKARSIQLAESLGLPVPSCLPWDTPAELARALQGQPASWVVKLRRSNAAKGVFYASQPKEVVNTCLDLVDKYHLAPERYPIVQQRVPGEGWGVSCLYWEGQRIASFTHRRLREKTPTGGVSTLRVSARNPLLEDCAHRLLDALNWHGLAMVEFKYDPSSRQGWFIEINPRLWGSLHLAIQAGVDFPALLYRAALEGPQAAQATLKPYREGIVARWLVGDWIAALGQLFHLRLCAALRILLLSRADTYDDWLPDDPGAFLGEVLYYGLGFLKTRSLNPVKANMLG